MCGPKQAILLQDILYRCSFLIAFVQPCWHSVLPVSLAPRVSGLLNALRRLVFGWNVSDSPLIGGGALYRTRAPHMEESLLAGADYRPSLCGCAGAADVADGAKPDYETGLVIEATTRDMDSSMAPPHGSHVRVALWLWHLSENGR